MSGQPQQHRDESGIEAGKRALEMIERIKIFVNEREVEDVKLFFTTHVPIAWFKDIIATDYASALQNNLVPLIVHEVNVRTTQRGWVAVKYKNKNDPETDNKFNTSFYPTSTIFKIEVKDKKKPELKI